jgi:hypothetical protein
MVRSPSGRRVAPGEIAANFQGAIGVNQDQIEGTDVTVPVFNFTETHYINSALVTGGYKLALFYLTGRVSDTDPLDWIADALRPLW